MPFVKLDAVKEAQELQEAFKDDPETKEAFRQYELSHLEARRLQEEENRLRQSLIAMRKKKKITQRVLQSSSGLSQQAISRIEVGKDFSPSLKSLIRYADAIGCHIVLETKDEALI